MSHAFRLDAHIDGEWRTLCRVRATDPWEAYNVIRILLGPDQYPHPIQIEPEDTLPPTWPASPN